MEPMEDEAVIAPVFWYAVLGRDDAVYKTASAYAHGLPELKAHLAENRRTYADTLQQERHALLQASSSSKNEHLPQKITDHIRWRREEYDLEASCRFAGLAYVPPEPFGRNMPLKWRWPTRDQQQRNASLEWLRRWDAWIFTDTRRRNRLQQSIDQVTERMRREKLQEQWSLLGDDQRARIVQSKADKLRALQRNASPRRVDVVDDTKGFVSAPTGCVAFGPDEEYKTRGEAVRALREGGF